MNLVDSLKIALANNFALYLKAHYYHWNVEGPDFAQYHSFFGDFYGEVYGAIDVIAEQIRALNAYAPGSFERYLELSQITGEDRIIPASEMLRELEVGNQTMISSLMASYHLAEAAGELGLANFLQDRLDQHKKHAWMIRSFLKGR